MSFAKKMTRKISKILNEHFKDLNKYAPILTLILTVGAGAITGLVRYGFYVYNLGVTTYWGLPKEIISIKSDSIIFEVLIYAIIVIPILLFNKALYKGLRNLRNTKKVSFWIIFVFMLLAYIALLVVVLFVSRFNKLVLLILSLLFLIFTVFCLPAFSFCFSDILFDLVNKCKNAIGKQKNNQITPISFSTKIKMLLVLIIIMALIMTILIFQSAIINEQEKETFRVIQAETIVDNELVKQTYVIIYETDDNYYMCPCVVENSCITEINKSTQKIVSRESIEYTYYPYAD